MPQYLIGAGRRFHNPSVTFVTPPLTGEAGMANAGGTWAHLWRGRGRNPEWVVMTHGGMLVKLDD